jgi:hypothetical protein
MRAHEPQPQAVQEVVIVVLDRGEDLHRTIKVGHKEEGPELIEPELALNRQASKEYSCEESSYCQYPPRDRTVTDG